ncbi:MAG: SDR family oxidoreductase [Actinomycetota bacterium]|nr:MAG: SDR family oxidoreductase [Actinomycetota bacterium]
MKENNLTGRTTIISGGASGIGRQVAFTFAEHGSNIAIMDINEAEGNKVVSEIKEKYKTRAIFVPCDISDYEMVKASCDKIIKEFKKIDNLVCTAGYGSRAALESMDISEWKKAVDINVNGPFYIVRSLIGNMLENKKGNIILIGSATVLSGSGGGVHYSTTKVAQYGLMKGLSHEFLSRGIRTNIVTPHLIDTPMLRKRYPDTPENNKMLGQRTPIGRIGKPEDIASTVLFLASDASSYICGTEILADGGAIYYKH